MVVHTYENGVTPPRTPFLVGITCVTGNDKS